MINLGHDDNRHAAHHSRVDQCQDTQREQNRGAAGAHQRDQRAQNRHADHCDEQNADVEP